jgi:hypothetical protein
VSVRCCGASEAAASFGCLGSDSSYLGLFFATTSSYPRTSFWSRWKFRPKRGEHVLEHLIKFVAGRPFGYFGPDVETRLVHPVRGHEMPGPEIAADPKDVPERHVLAGPHSGGLRAAARADAGEGLIETTSKAGTGRGCRLGAASRSVDFRISFLVVYADHFSSVRRSPMAVRPALPVKRWHSIGSDAARGTSGLANSRPPRHLSNGQLLLAEGGHGVGASCAPGGERNRHQSRQ